MRRYYQITPARLRSVEARWRVTLRSYSGAIPVSLGIAHAVTESDGIEAPTVRDAKTRPIGLMQVPRREGLKRGFSETDLQDGTKCIYAWAARMNDIADDISQTYPSDWPIPGRDFWLTTRLYWMVGKNVFHNAYGAARDAGYTSIVGFRTWVRTVMTTGQRFGAFNYADWQRIANHLDEVERAMITLDGRHKVSTDYTTGPQVSPGSYLTSLQTGAIR